MSIMVGAEISLLAAIDEATDLKKISIWENDVNDDTTDNGDTSDSGNAGKSWDYPMGRNGLCPMKWVCRIG